MSVSGDGSTGFITTSPNTFTGPASAYTMHCWYKNPNTPGTAASRGVVSMNDTPTNNYIAVFDWHHTTNPKSLFHRQSGGAFVTATLASSLLANTWYAIGARFDGSHVQLFLNGVADGASVAASAQTGSTSAQATILAEGPGTFNFDTGTVAEVGFWNTNLSDGEMLSLGLGVCPVMVRPTGLIQYVACQDTNLQNRLGLALSSSGLTLADHPPSIIYPRQGESWDRELVFIQNLQQSLTLHETEQDQQNIINTQDVVQALGLAQIAKIGIDYQRLQQALSLKQSVKVILDSIASGRFREVDGQQDG